MSWMRRALVSASQSAWLREHATRLGFVRRTAGRFLPGERLEDALATVRHLAGGGMTALVTHLGENVHDRAEAEAVTRDYLSTLESIRAAALPAEVSVKLTQLGLDLDRELCFANVCTLAAAVARDAAKTLWIDMEQSPYVDATLELCRRARAAHLPAGVCVQAYLYRSEEDVQALAAEGVPVRLVKGAYSEPPEIALSKKADVDGNFLRLAQSLLGPEARRRGVRAVMATHDRRLIARIAAWAETQGIPRSELEFAMLYGIQRAEQERLAREGYRSCVLVSYGASWFAWFMRRLAERPANLWFLLRNLLSR